MSEQIRFQADEDFNDWIVKGLLRREPLIDFETVPEVDLRGLPDPALIAFAAERGRILVSHDLSTMPTHFAHFLEGGHHSPGLFLIRQTLPISQAIEALYLVWQASTPEEWFDQMEYLPL
ncbi:MAG TPA: DUF5615 family PIN-like protein [Ktedonobacterales bacterium]|jgi:hypothetical protein